MSFEYKDPPQNKKRSEKKDSPEISRRGLLKSGLAFMLAAIGARTLDEILEKGKDEFSRQASRNLEPEYPKPQMMETNYVSINDQPDFPPDTDSLAGLEMITEQELASYESVADMLAFDKKGPITINRAKFDDHWAKEYSKPQKRKKLEEDFWRMGGLMKKVEERFEVNGVPKEFALLTIIESEWKYNARSEKGAVGPYQIMPKTGRNYGLMINQIVDERLDPLKSADVCARYLKKFYLACNDWNLVLATYNGGFAQAYIKEEKETGKKPTDEGFLKNMENELNKIKNDLHTNQLEHKLGNQESLAQVASLYGVNLKELYRINRLEPGRTMAGQKIIIPTTQVGHEAKRKIFALKISGIVQNLNYPSKYRAVLKLTKNMQQQEPIHFDEITVRNANIKQPNLEYTVAPKDYPYSIARRFNIDVKDLYIANKSANFRKLKPGDKIIIPAKTQKRNKSSISLVSEAKKRGKTLEQMKHLNPHILNAYAPLPDGIQIRA